LCASALDATAFFADLGNGGEVNMQRQEKNEQQRRDTDDASKFLRFGGQRRQHVKNLAQSIYLCQRPKLLGIIGHVLDAANSAGLSQRISSLVILLQAAGAAANRSRKFLKQQMISCWSSKPSAHRCV
jgi:hypothetical protein